MTNTKLNKEQQAAVDSDARRLLVLAGAGTGKTYTMIERIYKLVTKDKVNPSSILVLTFTNAAAFEMKERYRKKITTGLSPEFRTFHSFCYSLIVSDLKVRLKLGYTKIPKVADDSDIQNMKIKAKMVVGAKCSEKKFNLPDNKLSKEEQFQKQIFWKKFNSYLKESGLITFDKLCYGVCKLFVNDEECIQKYKQQYKYIFVDEYQDTDANQNDFVMSFNDSDIFVVGDALQALYSFRGADSSLIKALSTNKDWTVLRLNQNYRSTNQICNFANNMSHYADDTYRIAIEGQRDGDKVVIHSCGYPSYDIKVAQSALNDVLKKGQSLEGSTAILCRTNAEANYLIDELKSLGITPRTGKRNVDAINVLKSVQDKEYMTNWLSTFLNAAQYAEYIRLCALNEDKTPLEVLKKHYGNNFQINKRLAQISDMIKVFMSNQLRFQKCADIFKILDIPQNVEVDCEVEKASEFIENMIEAIQEDFESDLYVGTVHSSKGLEYDNVFLLNVDTKLFPLDNEDNMNVYYVGITRAKNKLFVYKMED